MSKFTIFHKVGNFSILRAHIAKLSIFKIVKWNWTSISRLPKYHTTTVSLLNVYMYCAMCMHVLYDIWTAHMSYLFTRHLFYKSLSFICLKITHQLELWYDFNDVDNASLNNQHWMTAAAAVFTAVINRLPGGGIAFKLFQCMYMKGPGIKHLRIPRKHKAKYMKLSAELTHFLVPFRYTIKWIF